MSKQSTKAKQPKPDMTFRVPPGNPPETHLMRNGNTTDMVATVRLTGRGPAAPRDPVNVRELVKRAVEQSEAVERYKRLAAEAESQAARIAELRGKINAAHKRLVAAMAEGDDPAEHQHTIDAAELQLGRLLRIHRMTVEAAAEHRRQAQQAAAKAASDVKDEQHFRQTWQRVQELRRKLADVAGPILFELAEAQREAQVYGRPVDTTAMVERLLPPIKTADEQPEESEPQQPEAPGFIEMTPA